MHSKSNQNLGFAIPCQVGCSLCGKQISNAPEPIKGTIICSAKKGPVIQIAGAKDNHVGFNLYCFAFGKPSLQDLT